MKYIALLLIKFYQNAISPHFPPSCRYYPTCSEYAYQSVKRYGFLHGCFLAFKRILRCQPFHAGGYDPVPDANYSKLDVGSVELLPGKNILFVLRGLIPKNSLCEGGYAAFKKGIKPRMQIPIKNNIPRPLCGGVVDQEEIYI